MTHLGEIIPQAYFSRHALRMAALMAPILRIYQFVLYIVAKPSAILLDQWLGDESIQYFKEKTLKRLIQKHVEESPDIDTLEGIGAINFLSLDDLLVEEEGETIHPDSIISLPFIGDEPQFPEIAKSTDDPFLQLINKSGHKWIIVLNEKQEPRSIIDADSFIRDALLDEQLTDPLAHTHRPIVVSNGKIPLGEVLEKFETDSPHDEDDEIKRDVVLLWGEKRQIITGSDILGRLLRGII